MFVEDRDKHSGSFLMEIYLSRPRHAVSEALSKELDSSLFQVMITNRVKH